MELLPVISQATHLRQTSLRLRSWRLETATAAMNQGPDDATSAEKEVSDTKSIDSPNADETSLDHHEPGEQAHAADEEKAPEQAKPAGPGPPPNGGMCSKSSWVYPTSMLISLYYRSRRMATSPWCVVAALQHFWNSKVSPA